MLCTLDYLTRCFSFFPHSNKLSSLQECIENLRQENGIVIPTTDHDWFEIDRADIMVRRSELVKDAVKEGRKKRFSPSKLINVSIKLLVYNFFSKIIIIVLFC